jgi:FdhE protein
MTIHITPQQQLESKSQQGINQGAKLPLLHLPHPKRIYQHRKQRFMQLAKANPLANYFSLCAKINALQLTIVDQSPITQNIKIAANNLITANNSALLSANNLFNQQWQDYLTQIINGLTDFQPQIDPIIQSLNNKTRQEKQLLATDLLSGAFTKVNSGEALFIWSALACYYTQLAAQLTGETAAIVTRAHNSPLCPLCHSHPIASIVHLGSENGLRYLQCSLCETQWYSPRVKCTNCQDMSAIEYYSLDKELAAVKTECCHHCHGYLKIFYQDIDPKLDIVVDDLNTLILDQETENAGFSKTGLNPMLFP